MKKRKIIFTLVLAFFVLFTGKFIFDWFLASDFMISKTIEQRNKKNLQTAEELLSKDEIHVVLVGTAGPMSPDLAQNATAVFVGGKFLLFDAGDYAQKRMEQFNLPCESLDAVFLTHFHNDHIADLGEVMQRSFILGRKNDLVIYGPTGVEEIVNGFNSVYAADSNHRTEHHGEEIMPSAYHFATAKAFDSGLNEVIVYDQDGILVTAFKNAHPPIEPSFGYAIEYKKKKIIISGDTIINENLEKHSKSADLLVMDIMNYELVALMENAFKDIGEDDLATIMYDIRDYHPNASDVGIMAMEQNVKRLALTHYAPAAPVKSMMKRFYIRPIQKNYKGELIVGGDGTRITIPLD